MKIKCPIKTCQDSEEEFNNPLELSNHFQNKHAIFEPSFRHAQLLFKIHEKIEEYDKVSYVYPTSKRWEFARKELKSLLEDKK